METWAHLIDKEVTVECSHDSGVFPLGETDVVYTVWDDSGNNSTCLITINVQEHACHLPTDPVTCPLLSFLVIS